MELEQVVEQMRLVVRAGDLAALRNLCNSPTIAVISKVAQLTRWELWDGVKQLIDAVPVRPAHERRLDETECEPVLVEMLAARQVLTLGDLERQSDDRLLEIPMLGYTRLMLLRAVQRKYLTGMVECEAGDDRDGRQRDRDRVRELASQGMKRREIAKFTGLLPRFIAAALSKTRSAG